MVVGGADDCCYIAYPTWMEQGKYVFNITSFNYQKSLVRYPIEVTFPEVYVIHLNGSLSSTFVSCEKEKNVFSCNADDTSNQVNLIFNVENNDTPTFSQFKLNNGQCRGPMWWCGSEAAPQEENWLLKTDNIGLLKNVVRWQTVTVAVALVITLATAFYFYQLNGTLVCCGKQRKKSRKGSIPNENGNKEEEDKIPMSSQPTIGGKGTLLGKNKSSDTIKEGTLIQAILDKSAGGQKRVDVFNDSVCSPSRFQKFSNRNVVTDIDYPSSCNRIKRLPRLKRTVFPKNQTTINKMASGHTINTSAFNSFNRFSPRKEVFIKNDSVSGNLELVSVNLSVKEQNLLKRRNCKIDKIKNFPYSSTDSLNSYTTPII
ncbi:hypothetical protein HDU92_000912 [Lobulomyces angularis]|nr:hypothetical protein HDU92_000912 [Lobulomyces angularis]